MHSDSSKFPADFTVLHTRHKINSTTSKHTVHSIRDLNMFSY